MQCQPVGGHAPPPAWWGPPTSSFDLHAPCVGGIYVVGALCSLVFIYSAWSHAAADFL
jgi:hypothetical protein